MWRNRTTDTEDEPVVIEHNDPRVIDRTNEPTVVRERTTPERVGECREEVVSFMPVGSNARPGPGPASELTGRSGYARGTRGGDGMRYQQDQHVHEPPTINEPASNSLVG